MKRLAIPILFCYNIIYDIPKICYVSDKDPLSFCGTMIRSELKKEKDG